MRMGYSSRRQIVFGFIAFLDLDFMNCFYSVASINWPLGNALKAWFWKINQPTSFGQLINLAYTN